MPTLHLFGGEQDGHTVLITTGRPEVFYAVPLNDYDKIRETKGKDAKLAIRERLAVLAYELYETRTNQDGKPTEYRYKRAPEKDKVSS